MQLVCPAAVSFGGDEVNCLLCVLYIGESVNLAAVLKKRRLADTRLSRENDPATLVGIFMESN